MLLARKPTVARFSSLRRFFRVLTSTCSLRRESASFLQSSRTPASVFCKFSTSFTMSLTMSSRSLSAILKASKRFARTAQSILAILVIWKMAAVRMTADWQKNDARNSGRDKSKRPTSKLWLLDDKKC